MQRALLKLEQNNSNQEHKDTIAYLEAQLKKKDDELQAALDSKEFEMMDIDVDNDSETQGLDPSLTTAGPTPGGGTTAEGASGSSNPPKATASTTEVKPEPASPLFVRPNGGLDLDGETPLFYRPGPAAGQQVTTVGWVRNGRYYINMYGKKSAPKYRLEKYADSAEYEDEPPAEQNISNSEIRFGDAKNLNGKRKYTKRHIYGLYGVAWNANNKSGADAVDLIDPDGLKMLDGSLGKKRWPDTYVLIAWNIDGRMLKKWEPRSTLRVRWGTKEADIAIHKAAVEQECRYEEATTGQRPKLSRSPSVGLADDMVTNFRQQSVPVRSSSPVFQHARFSEAEPPNKVSARRGPAMTKEEFIAFYCELAGAANFFDLDINAQQKCVIAWAGVQQPRLATV